MENKLISVVVPIFNEEENIASFYIKLISVLEGNGAVFEILFINDGSTDNSAQELEKLAVDNRVKIIELSRNFGKEAALSAGIKEASGEAAIMIDADFQHPVELIPQFIEKWQNGAEVVIGIRDKNKNQNVIKRCGSFLFYKIIKQISETEIISNETDFRLIDRAVIDAFNKLSEKNRVTRALIDWLGFKRDYIHFEANERANGRAGYSLLKLIRLAFNSFVSLSLLPLRLAGYLGLFIIITVGAFGFYVFLGKYIFQWAFAASFSGPAQLAILITFLVGVILSSLGLTALYVAHVYDEVLGRPLYIVRQNKNK